MGRKKQKIEEKKTPVCRHWQLVGWCRKTYRSGGQRSRGGVFSGRGGHESPALGFGGSTGTGGPSSGSGSSAGTFGTAVFYVIHEVRVLPVRRDTWENSRRRSSHRAAQCSAAQCRDGKAERRVHVARQKTQAPPTFQMQAPTPIEWAHAHHVNTTPWCRCIIF